jgi:hypothetical protein
MFRTVAPLGPKRAAKGRGEKAAATPAEPTAEIPRDPAKLANVLLNFLSPMGAATLLEKTLELVQTKLANPVESPLARDSVASLTPATAKTRTQSQRQVTPRWTALTRPT